MGAALLDWWILVFCIFFFFSWVGRGLNVLLSERLLAFFLWIWMFQLGKQIPFEEMFQEWCN